MRSRNIKPGICDNEMLGTSDPFHTLLFERLWMMADREGRLEDRPLRIKAIAFPYRVSLDIDPMLDWLAANNFIARYEVNGMKCIQILSFCKHQKPHKHEQASVVPAMMAVESTTKAVPEHNQGDAKTQPKTVALRSDSGFLIPDSGFLIPDSGFLIADSRKPAKDTYSSDAGIEKPKMNKPPSAELTPIEKLELSQEEITCRMKEIQACYPPFAGRQDWLNAMNFCHVRTDRGETTWEELLSGVKRYAEFCKVAVSSTKFVMTPGNFFGAKDDPWKQPWDLPEDVAPPKTAVSKLKWRPPGA